MDFGDGKCCYSCSLCMILITNETSYTECYWFALMERTYFAFRKMGVYVQIKLSVIQHT